MTQQLFSDHTECEKSLSEVDSSHNSSRVALELYLNVLTNQITLYDYIKLACVFLKALSRQATFFGIFPYQRVWLYFVFEGI